MTAGMDNKTLETNRRPAIPLDARGEFGCVVHAQACVSGGGRSALRWALSANVPFAVDCVWEARNGRCSVWAPCWQAASS